MDLTILCKSINSDDIKEQLKWAINGIDIVGCELTQNIAKILKEKLNRKISLKIKRKIEKIIKKLSFLTKLQMVDHS